MSLYYNPYPHVYNSLILNYNNNIDSSTDDNRGYYFSAENLISYRTDESLDYYYSSKLQQNPQASYEAISNDLCKDNPSANLIDINLVKAIDECQVSHIDLYEKNLTEIQKFTPSKKVAESFIQHLSKYIDFSTIPEELAQKLIKLFKYIYEPFIPEVLTRIGPYLKSILSGYTKSCEKITIDLEMQEMIVECINQQIIDGAFSTWALEAPKTCSSEKMRAFLNKVTTLVLKEAIQKLIYKSPEFYKTNNIKRFNTIVIGPYNLLDKANANAKSLINAMNFHRKSSSSNETNKSTIKKCNDVIKPDSTPSHIHTEIKKHRQTKEEPKKEPKKRSYSI